MNFARRAFATAAALVLLLLFRPSPLAAQSATAGSNWLSPSVEAVSPYHGPIAPDFGGDIGLFTIPTGDTLPAGAFSLGLYLQNVKLIAGENTTLSAPERNRYYEQSSVQGSIAFGLSRHIELFAAAGEDRFESRGGWVAGNINGLDLPGPYDTISDSNGQFRKDEPRKLRIGAKASLWSADSPVRLAIYAAANSPLGNDQNNFNTRRTDWEFGTSLSSGIFTGNLDYVMAGRRSTDPDIRTPNRLRFALGTDVPFGQTIHWISELDRNVFDGGDSKPPDYSNFMSGVRVYFGHTGLAVSAAVGANIDMLGKTKFGPSPLGGLVGLTYSPFPAPPPAPKPLPPPEPAQAEATPAPPPPAPPAPVAAPAPPVAPPAPQPRTTSDTIQFDAGSARLTNIAKAILDGVALRMKNDLNATALVTGYSDKAGSEDANMKISVERAQAAQKYLVERHGIDAARIKTEGKGSASPAADNATAEGRAKNRRAVIVVTLTGGA